jgi:tripartite-type tricarboxylate transporter receptor subunit TctC
MFSIGLAILSAGPACGQDYPNRVVRIVAPDAGGGADFAARLIAQGLSTRLGQQVIVENRGGGLLAGEAVSRAPPDGHTLLFHGSSLWHLPLLRGNLPWDPVRDFAPVTLAVSYPNVIVVHPSLPVKSVRELITLARARPGDLDYSSGVTGSSGHLAAELFSSMARVKLVRISYRGVGPGLVAVMSGEVQLSIPNAAAAVPHMKSGRLRALAVTSAQPSAVVPGLPTVAASGLPGYEAVSMAGLFAPAKTPAAIIARLNGEVVAVLGRPEVKERFLTVGVETVGNSPEQFATLIKFEMAKMGKVIREARIRAE